MYFCLVRRHMQIYWDKNCEIFKGEVLDQVSVSGWFFFFSTFINLLKLSEICFALSSDLFVVLLFTFLFYICCYWPEWLLLLQDSLETNQQSPVTIETEPHACIEIENHTTFISCWTWVAAWTAGACVLQGQKTTIMLHNMAAILHLIRRLLLVSMLYSVHIWYWISMLWPINSCQNKVSADPYKVTIIGGSVLEFIEVF